MIESIGERIIMEIILQRMVRIAGAKHDEALELRWSANAVEQLEALIEEFRPLQQQEANPQ